MDAYEFYWRDPTKADQPVGIRPERKFPIIYEVTLVRGVQGNGTN